MVVVVPVKIPNRNRPPHSARTHPWPNCNVVAQLRQFGGEFSESWARPRGGMVMNLYGRGDKDIFAVAERLGDVGQSFPTGPRRRRKPPFFAFCRIRKCGKGAKKSGKDAKKGGKCAPETSLFNRLARVAAKKVAGSPSLAKAPPGFRLRRRDLG